MEKVVIPDRWSFFKFVQNVVLPEKVGEVSLRIFLTNFDGIRCLQMHSVHAIEGAVTCGQAKHGSYGLDRS